MDVVFFSLSLSLSLKLIKSIFKKGAPEWVGAWSEGQRRDGYMVCVYMGCVYVGWADVRGEERLGFMG